MIKILFTFRLVRLLFLQSRILLRNAFPLQTSLRPRSNPSTALFPPNGRTKVNRHLRTTTKKTDPIT